ncbi:MAG: LamG domain-containing protein, partial [Planctomycetaceae bacterium]|nr:LamG domain-containing protein [Planctomycetaceae bacterium]
MFQDAKSLSGTLIAGICFCLIFSPLIAAEEFEKHWSFDDQGKVSGVFGNAMTFPADRPLSVEMSFLPQDGELEQITISAWIRPTDYERYNEIFRQECNERILFSLQERAAILSLGLNINGYEECDAPVDPAILFDGNWHYAVGTFDGQTMRVYLDGKEIESLERPGKIRVNPVPRGFIGSSSGTGEFFVGSIDELRISSQCVSVQRIVADYQAGREVLDKYYAAVDEEVQKFYVAESDFAQTLDAARTAYRSCIANNKFSADQADIRSRLMTRLRTDFPLETDEFFKLVGYSPVKVILEDDLSELREKVEQIVTQMTEYKPVTEGQWQLVSPDARNKWEAVERMQNEFQANPLDGSAQSLASLVETLKNAGEFIQERPHVREAVAPWMVPATPEPRTYSQEDAEKLLREDWLYQCDGRPTAARVFDEIQWTQALVGRLAVESDANRDFLAKSLETLALHRVEAEKLAQKIEPTSEECESLYLKVRFVKRQIMLSNPVIDFSQILLVDMPYPAGSEW